MPLAVIIFAPDLRCWLLPWQHPIVFTKASQSVVGPGAAIKYPHGWSDHVDYEAGELVHCVRFSHAKSHL